MGTFQGIFLSHSWSFKCFQQRVNPTSLTTVFCSLCSVHYSVILVFQKMPVSTSDLWLFIFRFLAILCLDVFYPTILSDGINCSNSCLPWVNRKSRVFSATLCITATSSGMAPNLWSKSHKVMSPLYTVCAALSFGGAFTLLSWRFDCISRPEYCLNCWCKIHCD